MGRITHVLDVLDVMLVIREGGQAGQGGFDAAARFAHPALEAKPCLARFDQLGLEPPVLVGEPAGPLEQALDALLQRLQFFFHAVDGRDSPPQGQADGRAPGRDGWRGRIG